MPYVGGFFAKSATGCKASKGHLYNSTLVVIDFEHFADKDLVLTVDIIVLLYSHLMSLLLHLHIGGTQGSLQIK